MGSQGPLRPVYVYGLTDPRDGRIYYIGQSVWPGSRRCDHEKRARWCTRDSHGRCVWIKQLQAAGLRPGLLVLEAVPYDADWEAAERAWIEYARWSAWPLTNLTPGGRGKSKRP